MSVIWMILIWGKVKRKLPKLTGKGAEMPLTAKEQMILGQRIAIPRKYRKIYDRAMSGRSRTAAIQINCLRCVCWERKEVRNCNDVSCPFFSYRPYRIPPSAKKRQMARAAGLNSGQGVPQRGSKIKRGLKWMGIWFVNHTSRNSLSWKSKGFDLDGIAPMSPGKLLMR